MSSYSDEALDQGNRGAVGPELDDNGNPIEHLVKGEAHHPKKPMSLFELYKAEGNAFVKAGKYDDALHKYDLAWLECITDDERAMILNNTGVVAEKMGNSDKALTLFCDALDLKPEYVKVLIRRGLMYKKQKQFQECFEDIAEAYVLAIKAQQFVSGIQETIANVILECAEEEIESMPDERKHMFPKDHFIRGYFRQFYCDPFSRMWKGLDPPPEAIPDKRNSTEPKGFRAALECMFDGYYADIPGHCTAEIDYADGMNRMEAYILRGSFNFLCGYKDDAIADFNAVIEDPDASKELKSTAHVKMAALMNLWSSPEDTASQFAEAEILWKENADVYYHAALCMIDKGEAIPAMALLEKGVEMCPDPKQSPLLHILSTTMKMSHHAYSQNPREVVEKLKNMESGGYFDSPECHEYYAQTLILLDDVEGAFEQFDKASTMSNGEKIFELKKVMARQITNPDPEETIRCLREFADDPEVGNTAWHHIGEMSFILGRPDEALDAFDRAIEMSHSVYDIKVKVMAKVDLQYNTILSEMMKKHGIDFSADNDLRASALE